MTYTVIENGTLIDGTGKEPLKNAQVVIKNNRIQSVNQMDKVSDLEQEDVTFIDAKGGYILPGMIDTHVHLTFEFLGLEERVDTPLSLRFYHTIKYMKETIDAGVTTVRDAGGADYGIKAAVEQGLVLGPRMQIAINAITSTGGHSDSWRMSGLDLTRPEYPGFPGGVTDGIEDVRKKTREMIRAGADIIKIHATGGVMSPLDHPEHTQFSPRELKMAVNEASYRGKKVMAHAQGAEGVKQSILAGIHSIEHGIYLDEESIDLMLSHDTYLVPTLYAPVSVLERMGESSYIPDYAAKKAEEVVEAHQKSFQKAYKAGVKIAMGTDASVFKHGLNLKELTLMCELGMTPMEAIQVSTKEAAKCLGMEKDIGTIEPDKYADIIIVNGDPLEDITVLENSKNIVKVLKDGVVVKG